MKIKQAMRYYFSDYAQSISVFYLVMVLLYALSMIPALLFPNAGFTVNGAEFSMGIFIFVLGLNSFRPQFRFFLQNGISRRTLLAGFHLSALCVAAGMTLVDLLFPLLFGRVLHLQPMADWMHGVSNLHPLALLWSVCLFLALAESGFLLTTLYYRMSKGLKLLFSIGVPVLLFMVLPLMGALLPGLDLFSWIARFVGWYLGQLPVTSSGIVVLLRFSANLLVTAGVCGLLSWLLVRKATLKSD